jgi:hypothetical protein
MGDPFDWKYQKLPRQAPVVKLEKINVTGPFDRNIKWWLFKHLKRPFTNKFYSVKNS